MCISCCARCVSHAARDVHLIHAYAASCKEDEAEFMKLWEQRARLPEVNNIEDYCFILTKNASLNYLEKENRHPTLSSEQLPEVSGQADSPEDTLISEELFARYVKALDRLPERCREVFIRLREEKQSYAQVAEELNISTKTVDAQLQKALTRLKEALLTE